MTTRDTEETEAKMQAISRERFISAIRRIEAGWRARPHIEARYGRDVADALCKGLCQCEKEAKFWLEALGGLDAVW